MLPLRATEKPNWSPATPSLAVNLACWLLRAPLGLTGESGCGKSTIAHAVTRLLKPPAWIAGGQILFTGQDIMAMDPETLRRYRWNKVSIVFQSAMNALNPVISIGAQIADTLLAHTTMSKREALERGAELLRIAGIESSRLKGFPLTSPAPAIWPMRPWSCTPVTWWKRRPAKS